MLSHQVVENPVWAHTQVDDEPAVGRTVRCVCVSVSVSVCVSVTVCVCVCDFVCVCVCVSL